MEVPRTRHEEPAGKNRCGSEPASTRAPPSSCLTTCSRRSGPARRRRSPKFLPERQQLPSSAKRLNWLYIGGRYWDRTSDLLGMNEWHGGRCWSLPQVKSLLRSHEVVAGRIGCCTHLLYRCPGLLNFDIKTA